MTTDTETVEFIPVGASLLPERYHDLFVKVLRGDPDLPAHRLWTEGVKWRSPNGSFPLSPGMSLEAVIREFDIKPVTAVSHNLAWEADDRNGTVPAEPGYTATYSILGVRTRTQAIYFLDGGCAITPVAVETLTERAEFIPEQP